MKDSLVRLMILMIAVTGCVIVIQAQNREKFVISAKAGGVNSVTGRVMLKRAGGTAEQPLTAQDDLVSHDRISTGGGGARAEVLLNPGSYLRLGENSEFELVDNSLDNLRVKLISGSAIIEATGADGVNLRIGIVTDKERLTIVRRGIYRLNVQTGSTELLVRKGRVQLGDNPRDVVKGGSKVIINSGPVLIAKTEKQDQDELDVWSKQRGENLARANERLSARELNSYLRLNTFSSSGAFGQWGMWTYSVRMGCYTFLPFYYGWTSPYGPYYGLYWNVFDYSPWRRDQVIANNPGWSGGSSGNSSVGSSGSPTNTGSVGPSPAITPGPSQHGTNAGPRDPDSGGRRVVKQDPN